MTMRIDRRQFLGATALAGVATALPAWAQGHTPNPELAALFDTIFREGLQRRPEGATQLGFDKGPNAALRGKLSDEGETGRLAAKAATADEIRRLTAIDRTRLDAIDQLNLDVVLYSARSAAAVQSFAFGGSAFGPTPYVISQNSGAYQSVPDFLDTKHPIDDASDADAYLSRLAAFGSQLDAQTARARHDAGLGVIPPDFILDLTLDQMTKTTVPASESLLVKSIAKRAAAKGLDGKYAADAARIYTASVLPALRRQVEQVKAMRAKATHDAGIWRFDHGPEFYEVALHNTTTTKLSPAEVHTFGLDQARMISSRLDGLLQKQGMTKGTVGERMAALYKDPRQLYANTDAGKVDAIAYCNDRLAAIKGKLPSVFSRVPPYSFEVRRVPPQTEAGAASAFSQAAAIDGSRPGIVYFNLHDSAEWPKFCLATTIYHEGLPGHQLEGGLALSNKDLPLLRKTQGFSGYAEGWALYAEQLADEIGMYDDDPMGRLGYLKFQLFRANRCVVDTGLHHLRWSYEQAWRYFVDGEGEAEGFARREVERYCSSPGQACSYKLGHSVFVDLREKAKAKLGPKFDIKAYHDAVLGTGRVPLDILKAHGEAWIASA